MIYAGLGSTFFLPLTRISNTSRILLAAGSPWLCWALRNGRWFDCMQQKLQQR
jgi:hypothetical protein